MPLCVKLGNADLFCLAAAVSRTDVSTLSEPGLPPDGGVLLMLVDLELTDASCVRIRVRSDDSLVLALESLSARGRPSADAAVAGSWPG